MGDLVAIKGSRIIGGSGPLVLVLLVTMSLVAACTSQAPAPSSSPSAHLMSPTSPSTSTGSPAPSASPTGPSAPIPSGSVNPDAAKIPLSIFVDLPRPPIWAVTKTDGWDVVVFDQGGVNQFKNTAGCLLTTQQNAGTVEPTDPAVAPTDASATGDYLETVISQTRLRARDFKLTSDPSTIWLNLGLSKTQQVQLGLLDFTYTRSDTGEPTRTLIATRVMPRSGSQLIANLSCPTDALEAARSVLEQLTIVPG